MESIIVKAWFCKVSRCVPGWIDASLLVLEIFAVDERRWSRPTLFMCVFCWLGWRNCSFRLHFVRNRSKRSTSKQCGQQQDSAHTPPDATKKDKGSSTSCNRNQQGRRQLFERKNITNNNYTVSSILVGLAFLISWIISFQDFSIAFFILINIQTSKSSSSSFIYIHRWEPPYSNSRKYIFWNTKFNRKLTIH